MANSQNRSVRPASGANAAQGDTGIDVPEVSASAPSCEPTGDNEGPLDDHNDDIAESDHDADSGHDDEAAASAVSEDQIGVVLMAYGTPTAPEQIEEYYTDIRRGRPPSPEQLADLVARYEAIGGLSPLAARTEAQRVAVQSALDELDPGRYKVVLGLKHAEPKIETAVDGLANDGIGRIVGAVLAPHFSEYSVGQYLQRLADAADAHDIEVAGVRSWATDPAFIDFLVEDLDRRINAMEGRTRVIFTAHSLPERILTTDDPYPAELRATAAAVAEELGLREDDEWNIAWQSAGRTPEPWLGPDILEAIELIAADANPPDGVIVSAVGFVADHLEVLYDLDIEARDVAEEVGLRFDRTTCVNDDASVMAALAAAIDRVANEEMSST